MIHRRLLTTTVFLMLIALPAAGQDAGTAAEADAAKAQRPDVAMVTSVSGKAACFTGGEELPLELGARLREGDEVVVSSGRAALVFLAGDYLALGEGERLTLGPSLEESTVEQGGGTRGLNADDGTKVAEGGVDAGRERYVWQAQLATVSGIRADAAVIAVAPRLTISDPNPVFCWFDTDTASGDAERSYTLALYDTEGARIATQQVRGRPGVLNSYRFAAPPAGLSAMPRTHYSWTVVPADETVPEGRQDAAFVYVDEAGLEAAAAHRQRIAQLSEAGQVDDASMHMLLSRYFLDERERLFSDAIPHLIALQSQPGGGTYAREQLAEMFLRFGNQVSVLAPRIMQSTVQLSAP